MLKEPRNTWRARERPVMPSARVRCFCASKSLKTGDDIYVFFSTLILYICSQGSVDCKSIPIYTLSESMDIEIPILLITCTWFICHQAIENSNSYRFYVVCWFLGSQPEEPRGSNVSRYFFTTNNLGSSLGFTQLDNTPLLDVTRCY